MIRLVVLAVTALLALACGRSGSGSDHPPPSIDGETLRRHVAAHDPAGQSDPRPAPELDRLCTGGDAAACITLGTRHVLGMGTGPKTADLTTAAPRFQRACDLGVVRGCSLLGLVEEARAHDPRALPLYQRAYKAERDVVACARLAAMHLDGRGVPRDPQRAMDLLQEGCDGGYLPACDTACDLDSAHACMHAAQFRLDGAVVAKDERAAAALFQKACDGRDPYACYQSALLAAADPARARALFTQACDGGDARGCVALGDYQKACELNDPVGCVRLGALLAAGKDLPKDEAKARELFAKACQGPDSQGCGPLGLTWFEGRGGAVDLVKAADLFERGCRSGDAAACTNLGVALARGAGVARDEARAAALYRHACDQGHARGCTNLGSLHAAGRGVPHDAARAADLFKQACAAGDAEGCANLDQLWK